MRRALQLAFVLLLATSAFAGEVVERIVATVNGQPILLGDWEIAMRYEAFLDQRALPLSADAARTSLDRLIDQELLRQQIRTFHLRPVSQQEIASRIEEIRRSIPGGGTDEGMRMALARYGLSDADLADRVANQLEILRFIDARLRPAVHIDRRAIEAYYSGTFLPELRQKGAREVPLADVSSQIEELLAEQRLDTILSDWLKDLRQQSDIRMDTPETPPPSAAAQGPR